MARKVLQIIESAYRATIEEQDDTVVWITHAMKAAGADLAVLLRGNAVNYLARGQDASGLSFGGRAQRNPPRVDEDVAKLAAKGVPVFFVREDADERGLRDADLIDAATPVARAAMPELFSRYDQVWHW